MLAITFWLSWVLGSFVSPVNPMGACVAGIEAACSQETASPVRLVHHHRR